MIPHQFPNPETAGILELVDASILITNGAGDVFFSNDSHRRNLGVAELYRKEIGKNIRLAAEGGQAVTVPVKDFRIKSAPIPNTELILTQINSVNGELNSMHDHVLKQSNDLSMRLHKLNLQDCIANSSSMIRVFEKARQVANFPTTVLIMGETGVGKEVVAAFIHRNSDRADKPFIKVNCSAIPEQLLESELFGYESGAFTGASFKGKAGLFELANGGTLLLDEIGDMSFQLQAKLLRVVQDNEILRLGGQKIIPLNVRVLSSTNRNLKEMMDLGQFSDALYYRLNVVELNILPLRERREDILPLSVFFLSHFNEKFKLSKTLSPEIKECFIHYHWPGNVRELRNIIENIVVSSGQAVIGMEDLPQRIIMSRSSQSKTPAQGLYMQDAVGKVQQEMIKQALVENGSLRKAAQALGMDPATLHRLAKKLGVATS
ncbi:MAG: sigma 54-interacting transcriptional regulator [Treponema sp.]|jgi:transcriptional regulator with PAS, ATPase and Fis domain|nr:sigma 54-interacting transcriptional regulator [Treponema sp.]